jgi:hypothetical protein
MYCSRIDNLFDNNDCGRVRIIMVLVRLIVLRNKNGA